MKCILLSVCTIAVMATGQFAFAQAHKPGQHKMVHDETSTKGYGTAGCGLGSIAFGQQHGFIQIVAATLNTTGMQTFGISSGTSNCEGVSAFHTAAIFIDVNQEQLKKDVARGQGESIVGLSRILNCSDSASFGQALQRDYSDLFGADHSPEQISLLLQHKIQNETNYKAVCGQVG